MSTAKESGKEHTGVSRRGRGLSWGAMLALVALAMLIAAGAAYLLVDPFFHQHAR